MEKPKTITTKVTVLNGVLGDFAREWMTEEDWEEHRKLVEHLKAEGEYGKPVEYEVSWIYNPLWDDVRCSNSSPLESFKFDIVDFSEL